MKKISIVRVMLAAMLFGGAMSVQAQVMKSADLEKYAKERYGDKWLDAAASLTQGPLKNWLKEAGITKKISYHSSRHTFGSLQVDAGTSVYTVQHMLGHKNVATTQIYAEMADESKRQSVDRITLKSATIAPIKAV